MSHTNTISAPPPKAPRKKLELFTVTIAWNPNDSSCGTFTESAWARDHDSAARKVASVAANHENAYFETEAGRKRFIQHAVSDSNTVVMAVAPTVAANVHALLSGPKGNMNKSAQADFDTIMALLAKYAHRGL